MKKIIKIILMTGLLIGGGIFVVLFPKIFVILSAHIIESLGGLPTENQKDENGNIIHQDWRKTIQSFGSRRQFAVEKGFWTEGENEHHTWDLFDRDKNKEIDEIRYFTQSSESPHVYTLGEKGYTKLNYETGEFTQSKNIDDFADKDKAVFEKLEIKKTNQKTIRVNMQFHGSG